MVKEIVKDVEYLKQKCNKVTDMNMARSIVNDLISTIDSANAETPICCGLAANQIGEQYRVAVVTSGENTYETLINPVIIEKSRETFQSTEGCMSLSDTRTVKRHRAVKVMMQNLSGKYVKKIYRGALAVSVQHEIDHLNGILI